MLTSPKEPAPVITKTANRFEVLHNLVKTKHMKNRREKSIQFCINNSNKKNQRPSIKESINVIPVIINGVTSVEGNKHTQNKVRNNAQQEQGHKIMIIGDSYAQGCAGNMKHNLSDRYKTSGVVKPGANINTLIASVKTDISVSTDKDIIVLWGGANDASTNSTQEGLKTLLGFFLRPTISLPVRLGIGPPFGILDQNLSCSSSFG
jgi:hypothetical protein